MSLLVGDSARMFGSPGWVVSMVGDALLSGSGEPVASGGSDGVSVAAVLLVGGDVADAGVQADGVVALLLGFEFGAEHVDVGDESAGYLPFPGIAPSSQGTEPPPNSEDVRGERAVDV